MLVGMLLGYWPMHFPSASCADDNFMAFF